MQSVRKLVRRSWVKKDMNQIQAWLHFTFFIWAQGGGGLKHAHTCECRYACSTEHVWRSGKVWALSPCPPPCGRQDPCYSFTACTRLSGPHTSKDSPIPASPIEEPEQTRALQHPVLTWILRSQTLPLMCAQQGLLPTKPCPQTPIFTFCYKNFQTWRKFITYPVACSFLPPATLVSPPPAAWALPHLQFPNNTQEAML